jgi:hypothetical protein
MVGPDGTSRAGPNYTCADASARGGGCKGRGACRWGYVIGRAPSLKRQCALSSAANLTSQPSASFSASDLPLVCSCRLPHSIGELERREKSAPADLPKCTKNSFCASPKSPNF